MRFVVVSGFSGSGKSSALHLLEDEGFTCIDNLPVTLLPALIDQIHENTDPIRQNFAIGIDARNIDSDLSQVRNVINEIKNDDDSYEILFLNTQSDKLVQRFSETRRRHPLSNNETDLLNAIEKEKKILEPISRLADISIDTSTLSLHELRSIVKRTVVGQETKGTTLIFSSFGFKFGLPIDADLVFDVRCLPNPYWDASLRSHTGKDQPVIDFLENEPVVQKMYTDIQKFISEWLPHYEENNRSYLTVSIGCTGGMHRSVYLCEKLKTEFTKSRKDVQVTHRQLKN